jgi:DNA-binding SARP family transcriptional activator
MSEVIQLTEEVRARTRGIQSGINGAPSADAARLAPSGLELADRAPRFMVLGPLEVIDSRGHVVTPSAPKLRQTLALLLLSANRVTPTASLVQELWGENPPLSALTTVQTYVYQLRKVLGQDSSRPGCGGALLTKPPGYVLLVERSTLDACEFETLVTRGRACLEGGNPVEASRVLARALELWTGPALADVASGPLLEAQMVRLNELRMAAQELRIDADMRLGRHRDLIGELKWLVASDRLNEWFYGRLMEALYRTGRRGEALDVYQRLRLVLNEELGLEPSDELRSLQREMLAAGTA